MQILTVLELLVVLRGCPDDVSAMYMVLLFEARYSRGVVEQTLCELNFANSVFSGLEGCIVL